MSQTNFGPEDAITEGSTSFYSCSFTTPSGNTVSGGAISAIAASLLDHTGTAINSRDEQSVLGANGGSISGNTFTLVLSSDDTVAVGAKELQPRTLLFRVTYDAGALVHRVGFFIRNTEL